MGSTTLEFCRFAGAGVGKPGVHVDFAFLFLVALLRTSLPYLYKVGDVQEETHRFLRVASSRETGRPRVGGFRLDFKPIRQVAHGPKTKRNRGARDLL